MRLLSVAGALAILFASAAQAQQPSKVPVTGAGTPPAGIVLKSEADAAERLVLRLAKPGSTIVAKFEAEMGLYGFIVSSGPDRNVIVYTDKAGTYMVTGQIFSGAGKNMSAAAMEQFNSYLPKTDFAPMLAAAKKAGWVEEGTGGGVIYALADPNCIYCKRLYEALREPVSKGHIRVRWIMVAILGDTSLPKAVDVMAAAGQQKSVDEVLAVYMSTKPPTPSLVPATIKATADKAAKARALVEKNGEFMTEFKISGTPLVLYAKKSGVVESIPGLPRSEKLSEIIRDAAE